ncbi:MAG: phenylacetate--CoA ligase, partial [Bacteroidota bacterium]
DDMLIIRGVNLFYTQVEEVIETLDYLVPNYQLIVSREGTMDEVQVRVEVAKGVNAGDTQLAQQLKHKIKDTVGITMKTQLEPLGSIPRSQGGKLKRVIDRR